MTKRWTALVLALLPLAAFAQSSGMPDWMDPSKVDRHGNPVFNSIHLADTTLANFGIVANYYTVSANIDDPASSVFMTEEPTLEEYGRFALETPSYFFLVVKPDSSDGPAEVSAMVMLLHDRDGRPTEYMVARGADSEMEIIPAKFDFAENDFAVIPDIRILELAQLEVDPEAKPMRGVNGEPMVIFNRRVHYLLSSNAVVNDVIRLVEERELYR